MFTPIEQSAWPAAGEVRDLRFSLNAPVLLGTGTTPKPTRAALGWMPTGSSAVVRLWLRADGAPQAVRSFDLPESPLGPAARASALERAERFLGGLGFLFAGAASAQADPGPEPWDGTREPGVSPREPGVSPGEPGVSPGEPRISRTSVPDPVFEPGAAHAADVATVVRADVRLTKFRHRGPRAEAAPRG